MYLSQIQNDTSHVRILANSMEMLKVTLHDALVFPPGLLRLLVLVSPY